LIVRTAKDAELLFAPIFEGLAEEQVAVAYLAEDRQVLAIEQFETGGTDEVVLPLRAIFADAMKLGANGLVIAHNHPSGDAAPSPGDVEASRALAAALQAIEVRLDDHLIFAGDGCQSFRSLGLL
jgi:DNA repair protein RadC